MPKSKINFLRSFAFVVLVLLPLFSFSQKPKKRHRNKAAKEQELLRYSSLSDVESTLTEATGWAVQNNGIWYSMENEIPFTNQKSDQNTYGARSLGQDNFSLFELRRLMIGNKQYTVLIKIYRDGKYQFPMLKQGWKGYNSLDYYVFESHILNKILPYNVTFNKPYAVDLHVFDRGTILDYEHKNWKSILVGHVQQVDNGEKVNGWNLVVAVYPIRNDGQEICRFRLIKTFRNNYLVSMYTAQDDLTQLFSRSFYEVKFDTFKNFIDAAKVNYINISPITSNGKVKGPFRHYFDRGILKYQDGDYLKAIQYFEKALRNEPDTRNFLLFSYLGNAQSKLHHYKDALGSYNRALELRPTGTVDYSNWIRNYFNRGIVKYYMNDMKGACSDWIKARELGLSIASKYIQENCHKHPKGKKEMQ